MGQFSWLDCKTGEQVLDNVRRDVYVLLPGGGHIKETCYDGYGHFGGYDAYALLAQWNAPDRCTGDVDTDREVGIKLFFGDQELKYPLKITHDPDATYDECSASPDDPDQGWRMEDDDDEEDWYDDRPLWEVEYTDPDTGATSAIDIVSGPVGYTPEQYIADCMENGTEEWCEMLHRGSVRLVEVKQ